eukprot:3946620-Pleurochrysis_carterae.AAC.1
MGTLFAGAPAGATRAYTTPPPHRPPPGHHLRRRRQTAHAAHVATPQTPHAVPPDLSPSPRRLP